jgi:hypothetical protein
VAFYLEISQMKGDAGDAQHKASPPFHSSSPAPTDADGLFLRVTPIGRRLHYQGPENKAHLIHVTFVSFVSLVSLVSQVKKRAKLY